MDDPRTASAPSDDRSAGAPIEPDLRGHLPALDGVRALAVLMVIAVHGALACGSDFWATRVGTVWVRGAFLGAYGVQLFFALSGFLITGILCASRGRPRFFRTFYGRRTLRIFPLYYATLVAFLVVGRWTLADAPGFHQVVRDQAWYWLYAQNWYEGVVPQPRGFDWLLHFWTLAVEEQFYLVWPAIVWLSPPRRLLRWTLAMMVVGPIAHIALTHAGASEVLVKKSSLTNVECLGAGAALAILARRYGLLALRRPAIALGSIALAVAAAAYVATRGHLERFPGTSLALGLASVAALVVALTAPPRSAPARLLANPALRHVGARSYAIYVLHQPIMLVMERWWTLGARWPAPANHVAFTLVALAFTVVAAEISWRLLEAPCLALKRFFPAPRDDAAAAPAAAAPSAMRRSA